MWIIDVRHDSAIPLEFAGITHDRLSQLKSHEVSKLPVLCGSTRAELGEFAKITPNITDTISVFRGDTGKVKRIGAGMKHGMLKVDGDAGMHAGAEMVGGFLCIGGNAGDWLGAEMRGGEIAVAGNAGHNAGSAYRGSRHGMRGGWIHVSGNAGDELGLLMRRGCIVVDGTIGEFAGASMIAGTLVGKKGFGPHAGAGMKRGTLISCGPTKSISPGFRYCCEYEPAYLDLFRYQILSELPRETAQCYRGDVLTGGRGELLVLGGGSTRSSEPEA